MKDLIYVLDEIADSIENIVADNDSDIEDIIISSHEIANHIDELIESIEENL